MLTQRMLGDRHSGGRVQEWLLPIVLLTVALLVFLYRVLPVIGGMPPRLHNDSFQYLTLAKGLGYGISTTLVHFDTERSHGVIPAPMTWFPAGYPAMLAALSAFGVDPELAGLGISLVAFLIIAVELWVVVTEIGGSVTVACVSVLMWLTNAHVVEHAMAIAPELPFTAILMAAGFAIARERFLVAAVLCGTAVWIRYAGTIFFVGFCALAIYRSMRLPKLRFRIMLSMAVAALFAAPLYLRNVSLVGDWRGGNNSPIDGWAPVLPEVVETLRALYHMAVGDAASRLLLIPLLLLAGGTALTAFRARIKPIPKLFGLAAVFYVAAIGWITWTSFLVPTSRYYLPAVPFALVMLAAVRIDGWPKIAAAVALCGYVWANAESLRALTPDKRSGTVAAIGSAREQLSELRAPIFATNAQALGYVLDRPTVSLVGYPYTETVWTPERVEREMNRFGGSALVIFRDPELDSTMNQPGFLEHPESRFDLLLRTDSLDVYCRKGVDCAAR